MSAAVWLIREHLAIQMNGSSPSIYAIGTKPKVHIYTWEACKTSPFIGFLVNNLLRLQKYSSNKVSIDSKLITN